MNTLKLSKEAGYGVRTALIIPTMLCIIGLLGAIIIHHWMHEQPTSVLNEEWESSITPINSASLESAQYDKPYISKRGIHSSGELFDGSLSIYGFGPAPSTSIVGMKDCRFNNTFWQKCRQDTGEAL